MMNFLKFGRLGKTANKNSCQLCTKSIKKVQSNPTKKRLIELNEYFESHPHLNPYLECIPTSVLNVKHKKADNIYLICPDVAKVAAKYILDEVKINKKQMIAEINPGIGILTKELLDIGVKKVHLYEPNNEFYPIIKTILGDQIQRVSIIEKDLLNLGKLASYDKKDGGNRVESILQDVPHKKWNDDPSMTIIGPMMKLNFLKHLTSTIILQKSIWNKGRIDMYTFTMPGNWNILVESNKTPLFYRCWMILFSIFFNVELIEKFDRKLFLPWESNRKQKLVYPYTIETDKIYFIKISMKKEFPINHDDMLAFFVFLKAFLRFTNKDIIPTIEKWVPGCGKNLIAPKLRHLDYFQDLDIFTKFKELSPLQTLAIFREMISHPNINNSPFMEMIEAEFISNSAVVDLSGININATTEKLLKELNLS